MAECCGQCCKSLRRCRKSIRRNLQVLCSPQKMGTVATMFLDSWVNQRTILTFSLLEIAISVGAFAFYHSYTEISELGWFITHWVSYLMILTFRSLCGVVGFFGACMRRVKITRFYFGALVMNIPLTFITVLPFWSCSCACEEDFMLATITNHTSIQCKVLGRFKDPIPAWRDFFNTTSEGIGWTSRAKDCQEYPDPWNVFPEESWLTIDTIRNLLNVLRLGKAVDQQRKGKMSDWTQELEMFQQRCLCQDSCAVLDATLRYFNASEAGPLGQPGYRFKVCLHYLPVYPEHRQERDAKHDYAFFQKDWRLAMDGASCSEDDSMDKCYACVTLAMISLALLDFFGLPMVIIVYKFLARHCGDYSRQQHQFAIEFSSEEDLSERPDFSASGYPSTQISTSGPSATGQSHVPPSGSGAAASSSQVKPSSGRSQHAVPTSELMAAAGAALEKSALDGGDSSEGSFVSMRPINRSASCTSSAAAKTRSAASSLSLPQSRQDSGFKW